MLRIFSLMLTALLITTGATAQLNPNKPKTKPVAPAPSAVRASVGAVVLKVTSNVPCTFYVDGVAKGTANAEVPLRVTLRPGEYRFKAVSKSNSADVWQETETIDDAGTEQYYEIDLQAAVEEHRREEEAGHSAAMALSELENNMVRVEGGTFTMGCTQGGCSQWEFPDHPVTLGTFYISKYEVTEALWRAVMGNNHWSNYNGCDQCPVYGVRWNDAQEFIRKLNAQTGRNYRLPTEAEWEYAARGGQRSRGTIFAGSNDLNTVAWNTDNSGLLYHPVGLKQANELGLYDMSGNAKEWCQDWFGEDYYGHSPSFDPAGPSSGTYRVMRGGGLVSSLAECRVFDRAWLDPDEVGDGFRLSRSL